MKKQPIRGALGAVIVMVALGACSPKVYLIDRQTVLERQAAGVWPELDGRFYEETVRSGPTPLAKTADRPGNRRMYRMTHSDAMTEAADGSEQARP